MPTVGAPTNQKRRVEIIFSDFKPAALAEVAP